MNPGKTLGELLGEWMPDVGATAGTRVTGLSLDSRDVVAGDLFFAYPGDHADGRYFIDEALTRGAAAVVCEIGGPKKPDAPVPVVSVEGLREKVGVIAERFFDNPSRGLFIVGITGTNGKTSCAHLLAQAFGTLGVRSGLIGTLGWGFMGALDKTPLTTPDPVSVHRMLRRLCASGATHVCMEVSSHALVQGRVSGVAFDAALFTNITHDHLDYHADFEHYARAKARLFESATLRFAVLNRDDDFGRDLAQRLAAPVWTYGLSSGDVSARDLATDASGLRLVLETPFGPIATQPRLVGRVNVHNILAVAAVLLADRGDPSRVAQAIDRLEPVPGRMELFQYGARSAPSVVVDYAHTPDALERALSSLREHCTGRLWCVFGCGGDRDRTKRPVMGRIAERLADRVVVTDDNPRHEAPTAITAEIVVGMSAEPPIINDRVRAIRWAIEHACRDDWILIAGKGHETTQQIGDEFIEMNDRTIVSDYLGAAA